MLPLFPGEAFAKLYRLTGGELRVALAMAGGLQPQDAADTLGIGLQTVKTHLQHIFQKTNTSRQAELVALISRANISRFRPRDGSLSGAAVVQHGPGKGKTKPFLCYANIAITQRIFSQRMRHAKPCQGRDIGIASVG